MKAANTAKLIVQLAILIQLLWYSGWLPAEVTTWFQLITLVLLGAVLFVLRKKRKKPRKKPAVKEKIEEAANE
ncbi:LPXTG cell wall anchor domain-containing protein [Brevibacillus migulae]|uniref:LPXTG cell wall anchor domain-containing protein n=1 Tax=Brevibacillus migulae TaxID=1644114 RepID=UPI00106EB526|nr:LPXTG cell wall anchor domain-containing protein [Brevibacillus migulae]